MIHYKYEILYPNPRFFVIMGERYQRISFVEGKLPNTWALSPNSFIGYIDVPDLCILLLGGKHDL